MSDKYLVETSKPLATESYTAKRSAQQLRSLRAGQAKQLPTLKQREEEQRRAGLATSLFEVNHDAESSGSGAGRGGGGGGGGMAMEMMKKMGWKVGEGLGRKRSASLEAPRRSKVSRLDNRNEDDDQDEISRQGIGSSNGRIEPIRISMWAGRKGLSARSPSPPPLPNLAGRNPDALDPRKLARLEGETDTFRERQRREFGEREVVRKAAKAREILVRFDRENGVKVGPLLSSGFLSLSWPPWNDEDEFSVSPSPYSPFRSIRVFTQTSTQTHIPRSSTRLASGVTLT